MIATRQISAWSAQWACAVLLAGPALAAPPQAPLAPAVPLDIALRDGGVLAGQLVDTQGAPLTQAPVSVLAAGREVGHSTTDAQGNFHVAGLPGGVYELAAPGHHGVYRLWAPQTAPPAAVPGVLVVSGGALARGQYPPASPGPLGRAVGWMVEHPIITVGAVAAAVAIPVAVVNASNDDEGSVSGVPAS
jgi:hypothetical protein